MKKIFFFLFLCIPVQATNIVSSTTWFGNGGYKIPKQDIWPQTTCSTCTIGANWDGTTAKLAGFRNEMVGGMLWMKAGASAATSVNVALSPLSGPGGSVISSTGVLCAGVTDYTTRDFELFVATYVQVIGMTENSWNAPPIDERDIPYTFQNPYSVDGNNDAIATPPSLWNNRNGANKFFPDALVPQECASNFTVAASSSQGVWMDFYLRKNLNSGLYTGTITVTEGVSVSTTIPIQLMVYNGTLPDQPSYNYIAYDSVDDINYRLNGIAHNAGCTTQACISTDEEFDKALHRHRLIPIGDSPDTNTNFFPSARYQLQLSGSLFSSTYKYQGPGINTGSPIYSIGTYATWVNNPNWSSTSSSLFCVATSSWGAYFKNNFPNVRSFVYLADEPTDLTGTNQWSTWMSTISACQTSGYNVHSWVTADWPLAVSSAPYIDMPASTDWISKKYVQTDWQNAANRYLTTGSTQGWAYNGHPSWEGSVNAIEDDGISGWEGTWADYLKGVKGHFQWQTTGWNIQGNGSPAENPLWTQAKTFGFDNAPSTSAPMGHFGFNFANGDGVLFYPGTEVSTYTASNYGFLGPVATLRLKALRRGLNDYDYLTLASQINSPATQTVLKSLVPSALWDINCFTNADCSYSYGGRLWSQDPNAWELARQQLANIITNGYAATFGGPITINGGVSIQ